MAEFSCAGGCGKVIIDPATNPSEPGWSYLPITGRWRCPYCTRELAVATGSKSPDTCPLPTYDCACKGNWCRLLGRNLK